MEVFSGQAETIGEEKNDGLILSYILSINFAVF